MKSMERVRVYSTVFGQWGARRDKISYSHWNMKQDSDIEYLLWFTYVSTSAWKPSLPKSYLNLWALYIHKEIQVHFQNFLIFMQN